MTQIKKLSILLLILLLLISHIPLGYCSTTETRYFRSDTDTINGLLANKLLTSQSGTSGYKSKLYRSNSDTDYVITAQFGIQVWKRTSEGTETEITSGSQVAIVTETGGAGMRSATWGCPQTSLSETDSIVVIVYVRGYYTESGWTSWSLMGTWQTEQIGATQLDGVTWTVYYYTYLVGDVPSATARFYYDTATYNSRIENFQWSTGAPPAEERSFTFTETMKPSATLYQWQEHSRVFTETIIVTANFYGWQEHSYVFQQTITPSETVTYWQEQIYTFTETTTHSAALYHWIEGAYQFFEYSFTETIHPLAIIYYWIESTVIINFVGLGLSSLGFALCLFPLTGDDDSAKALATVTLILSLAGVAFAVLGFSYALPIGAVALVLSLGAIALATKKN